MNKEVSSLKNSVVSIIIPTYNEKNNINILLERITKSLDHNYEYEIVVIDDNSPDGTGKVVQQYENDKVRLIERKDERGLASAVVAGFKNARGNIFVVMDADLQHPPEKISSLIEEINNGYDIVIASRYLNENGFENFNLYRKIISKLANIPAKILLPKLKNVKDIQSGFFALNKNVIIDAKLDPIGYKILIEILAMGNYSKVKEIPYEFNKRERGDTKLGSKVIFDYLHQLVKLYWKKNN